MPSGALPDANKLDPSGREQRGGPGLQGLPVSVSNPPRLISSSPCEIINREMGTDSSRLVQAGRAGSVHL